MEVHFTPEQEAKIAAAIRTGIAEADRGALIDDDEVRLWLEQQEDS